MGNFIVHPSSLQGSLYIPSSKSHTLRAIVFASFAKGESEIWQYLPSPDTKAMIEAVRLLGAQVSVEMDCLKVTGFAGTPQIADNVIDCGNSGIVLRFIGALAGLIPQYTILTGDLSIRHNRPVKPLLEGLNQLGSFATSSRGDDRAPIIVKGPFTQDRACIEGQDSQPVSGLLIAAAFAKFRIEICVTNPGEKPWIDLTLDWFRRLNISYVRSGYTRYQLQGCTQLQSFSYTVPGDFSTAAFPIAAALITNSELVLHNIDMSDIQGDKALIFILEKMGAVFSFDEEKRKLIVHKGAFLKGITVDINDCIDALPILAVVGCFASGKTEIVNAAIARKKESDRISAISQELMKMGANLEEKEDGLVIYPSQLHGAVVHSHYDHRIALSLTVAALGAKGLSEVCDVECIEKTYPDFCKSFQSIGACISV